MSSSSAQAARFVSGSIMGHVTVMTLTGAIGLMALFLVDLADLFFLSLLDRTEITAAIGFAGTVAFINLSLSIGLGIAAAALVARNLGAGETTTATQSIVVEDTMAPSLSVPASLDVEVLEAPVSVDLGEAEAADLVTDPVAIHNDAPEGGFDVGTTTVTWTATDEAGNRATEIQRVTVRLIAGDPVAGEIEHQGAVGADPPRQGVLEKVEDPRPRRRGVEQHVLDRVTVIRGQDAGDRARVGHGALQGRDAVAVGVDADDGGVPVRELAHRSPPTFSRPVSFSTTPSRPQ